MYELATWNELTHKRVLVDEISMAGCSPRNRVSAEELEERHNINTTKHETEN